MIRNNFDMKTLPEYTIKSGHQTRDKCMKSPKLTSSADFIQITDCRPQK